MEEKILNYFQQTKTKTQWMLFKYLPVIPPNIRPIVKLQEKVIITTDLNFLYANLININNKFKKLEKMSVPKIFLNGEKYALQSKVDRLILVNKNKNISTVSFISNILKNVKIFMLISFS